MLLSLLSSVVWVDFFYILLSKYHSLGSSLDRWYSEFGILALISDCLIIVLGILLARMLYPHAELMNLVLLAIIIQLVHDVLFFFLVVKPMPTGTNRMIDLFKSYAAEHSWKILVVDSSMIALTVLLADSVMTYSTDLQAFIGLLGVYALTFVINTKNAP
jgi:uncharacterized protein YacL